MGIPPTFAGVSGHPVSCAPSYGNPPYFLTRGHGRVQNGIVWEPPLLLQKRAAGQSAVRRHMGISPTFEPAGTAGRRMALSGNPPYFCRSERPPSQLRAFIWESPLLFNPWARPGAEWHCVGIPPTFAEASGWPVSRAPSYGNQPYF
ncbi:uncharacterized protein EbC_pEb10200950 (plasmid) [Erwinia billingiae Eb661]|uniref:Uncharacterized protein n=1 Tax=Erwinia billingiae (strain Eb661) TaxID=634500 RepID=D8MJI5_ERWBE|nr:uncharacterized protein EbC_pEb10200950 [Erwinia billingiae Eb661]